MLALTMYCSLLRGSRLQRRIRNRHQPHDPEVEEQAQRGEETPVRENGSEHAHRVGARRGNLFLKHPLSTSRGSADDAHQRPRGGRRRDCPVKSLRTASVAHPWL